MLRADGGLEDCVRPPRRRTPPDGVGVERIFAFLRSSLAKVEMRFSLAPRAPVFDVGTSRPPGADVLGSYHATSRGAHDLSLIHI